MGKTNFFQQARESKNYWVDQTQVSGKVSANPLKRPEVKSRGTNPPVDEDSARGRDGVKAGDEPILERKHTHLNVWRGERVRDRSSEGVFNKKSDFELS